MRSLKYFSSKMLTLITLDNKSKLSAKSTTSGIEMEYFNI